MNNKISITLDFDDVLGDCNGYAIKRTNAKYGTDLKLKDIKLWGNIGTDLDKRLECYEDEEFFKTQPLLRGAKKFVRKLVSNGKREVFIATDVNPKFAHIRIQKIIEELPEIKAENILIGSRKDIIKTTVMLDDNPKTILNSIAEYRVLFRRPWNSQLTGTLSVSNYKDFLTMIEQIENNNFVDGKLKFNSQN